ncbi:MAG: M48 family metallopeptidase [Verrucomicrobiota bacterium]
MDFFGKQDQAKKNTKRLGLYFFGAVVLTVTSVYFMGVGLFLVAVNEDVKAFFFQGANDSVDTVYQTFYAFSEPIYDDLVWREKEYWILDAELFLLTTLFTGIIIFIGSSYKTHQLSKGGAYVATLLGGRLLNPETEDLDEKKLLHVVEEMAIASGMSTPQVFIMDREVGINAFAAGFNPSDSVIGVTRGSLKGLSRDELQGVIAHEFSHILNGDMAMNMRLVSLSYGILFISIIGRYLMRMPFFWRMDSNRHDYSYGSITRNRNGKGGGLLVIVAFMMVCGFCLYLIGSVGYLISQLLRTAVSRQREFLADASAVQFTRNKEGILRALLKIGGYREGSKIINPSASEVSHFFFGSGLSGFDQWFSTHPPLKKRVEAMDPNFQGIFPEFDMKVADLEFSDNQDSAMEMVNNFCYATAVSASEYMRDLEEKEFTPHLYYAQAVRQGMPQIIYRAAHEPFGARALIYGVLLDYDDQVRRAQIEQLEKKADPEVVKELHRLWEHIWKLPANHKIPVIDISTPALRLLSAEQYETFRSNVKALVHMDQKISLFEFVLEKMLIQHLDITFKSHKKKKTRYNALLPIIDESMILLSTLAHISSENADAAEAFHKGSHQLNLADASYSFLPQEECGLAELDESLDKISYANMAIKKNILYACCLIVLADNKIDIREAELLRAIADVLECPIPPFVLEKKM